MDKLVEQCDKDAAEALFDACAHLDHSKPQDRVTAYHKLFAEHFAAERAQCFAHIREQAGRADVVWEAHRLSKTQTNPRWADLFTAMLDQIERTDNATK
jgi:hypothetical protein